MSSSTLSKIIMTCVVVLIALTPFFHVAKSIGTTWKGVVPEYIEDSTYYYARMNDVVRGHPYIGNPYFIEHQDEIPPAFFLSDWIASIPFLLRIPFGVSVVFNIVVWSLIFTGLLYLLFRKFSISSSLSCLFAVVTWVQVFWLFVRPVAMQTVFPAYIFFLISLFLWFKEPGEKKYRWMLVISTLCSVYFYTYLMQIVVLTMAVFFVYLLVTKRFTQFKNFSAVIGLIILGCIPFLVISFFQVSHPFYLETMVRIGLLSTHIPRMEFLFQGRWIVLAVLLWWGTRRVSPSFKKNEPTHLLSYVVLVSVGLIIASGSNIITGKELEIANHIARFSIIWTSVVLCTYFGLLIRSGKSFVKETSLTSKVVIGVLVLIGLLSMIRNIPRAFPFFRNPADSFVRVQDYAEPLAWLKNNVATPTVVWSDDAFSTYVPIMTQHYVLFNPSGALQILSDGELKTRYLLSRSRTDFSKEDLKKEVKLYGGAGHAFGLPEKDYDAMWKEYEVIKSHQKEFVEKFNVGYVVVDIRKNQKDNFSADSMLVEVHRDTNFVIYKIK